MSEYESILKQYDRFPAYQRLCELYKINTRDELNANIYNGEIWRCPAIAGDDFKKNRSNGGFLNLNLTSRNDLVWTVSSSTSGDPSYVLATQEDINKIRHQYGRQFTRAGEFDIVLMASPDVEFMRGPASKRFSLGDGQSTELFATAIIEEADHIWRKESNVILYLTSFNKRRTIFDNTIGKIIAPIWNNSFGLITQEKYVPNTGRPTMELHYSKAFDLLERASKSGERVMIGPSILMIYPMLKSFYLQRGSKPYENLNITIVTGAGGWDGKKGVSEADLPETKKATIAEMEKILGLSKEVVRTSFFDIYGTTESGIAVGGWYDPEVGEFIYEIPDDIKLFVLDKSNNEPVSRDEEGYPVWIGIARDVAATAIVRQFDLVTAKEINADH
jgi:hypothetical protein